MATSPVATPPDPSATDSAPAPSSPPGKADQLKIIGGLLALIAGLLGLLIVLALARWQSVTTDQFTQLATTVIGIIGSIVGAYFGVKIGTDGTNKALEAQRQESARAQIFAAHLPPDLATTALELAFPSSTPANATPGAQENVSPAPPPSPA
jgi:hypothetical protein